MTPPALAKSTKHIMAQKIVVSDIEIEVNKKDIKNMRLAVLPPGGYVRISAPLHTSDEVIRLFAITKIGWIKRQVERFQNQLRRTKREYVSGESHYLWGRPYKLQVLYTKNANGVEIVADKLILFIREPGATEQREKVLNEWYRAALRAKLPALINKWAARIGVQTSFVGIKNMRTRWGSCNVRDKRVWVNLQLAKRPISCLEYIVVHELVHLLEKTHSRVFMELMDKFLPDWRAVKAELNGFAMDSSPRE